MIYLYKFNGFLLIFTSLKTQIKHFFRGFLLLFENINAQFSFDINHIRDYFKWNKTVFVSAEHKTSKESCPIFMVTQVFKIVKTFWTYSIVRWRRRLRGNRRGSRIGRGRISGYFFFFGWLEFLNSEAISIIHFVRP